MARRITLIVVGVLVLALAVAYLVPTPRADPDELYAEVDDATVASLRGFRATRPVQQVAVGEHTWEYVVAGDGPTTVLFLHGMGGAYDIWWQQIEALEATHRVVAPTYPAVPSLDGLADGLLTILDTEGIDEVAVVGSSLGGYLAQYLVQHHPDRVSHAVFSNTFPPNDLLRAEYGVLGSLIPYLPEWVVLFAFRFNSVREVVPASEGSPLVEAYLREQGHGAMSKAQFNARYRAVIDPLQVADPEPDGIPLLIIEADNDPLIAAELREELVRLYPTAEVYTFHGAGHFPYLNRPDEYTALLRDHLG